MAGGVYTLARTAIHDALTLALAALTGLAVTSDRVPPVLAVLAAGALGWLLISPTLPLRARGVQGRVRG